MLNAVAKMLQQTDQDAESFPPVFLHLTLVLRSDLLLGEIHTVQICMLAVLNMPEKVPIEERSQHIGNTDSDTEHKSVHPTIKTGASRATHNGHIRYGSWKAGVAISTMACEMA